MHSGSIYLLLAVLRFSGIGIVAKLAVGILGHIAFPITTGGSLFLVALAGILVLKERVGSYGLAGLIIGILSLVVLSLG